MSKAQEAGVTERQLVKQREAIASDQINYDLGYSVGADGRRSEGEVVVEVVVVMAVVIVVVVVVVMVVVVVVVVVDLFGLLVRQWNTRTVAVF